jgi:hypothetical protein
LIGSRVNPTYPKMMAATVNMVTVTRRWMEKSTIFMD